MPGILADGRAGPQGRLAVQSRRRLRPDALGPEGGPVVFVDHKRLYPIPGEGPDPDAETPIGKGRIARHGADLTIAAHSFMVHVSLQAAEILAGEGISIEVIDLRSLAPLDVDLIHASVSRTGALLTVEEGQVTCGVGVEVAARVRERGAAFAVARVGAIAAPVSSNPVLEAASIPNAETVARAARLLLGARDSGHSGAGGGELSAL